jgi:hypothetical protein
VKKLCVRKCKNLREKIQGMIGKSEPMALMIKTRFGIHTFGVKFPIDVLILNNENKVVSLKEGFKPNRIFLWNPMHEKVIELPAETIKRTAIKMHDIIELELSTS